MFYFDKTDSLLVLKSDKLKINHFFTTRNSIIKTKEKEFIELANKNKEIIKKYFNLKFLISPSQRHTSNIEIVDERIEYPYTDALILNNKDIGIFLNFADCTPVILFDTKNNAGAIIHAGWRGTKEKIVQKTFYKMNSEFKTSPDDVIAVIGPSICKDCFETNNEIADMLSESVIDNKDCIFYKNDKYYADLKEINKRQLNETGILNVDVCDFCTYHNNDKFFSYRKENKTTNRISAFLTLN